MTRVVVHDDRRRRDHEAGSSPALDAQAARGRGSASVDRTSLPVGAPQMLHLQRAAGNRVAQQLGGTGPLTVQRLPGASSVKKAAGAGAKKASALVRPKTTAAAKAEEVGAKAQSAKIVTVADLDKQVATLEKATIKLIKAHQAGDAAGHMAAFQVHGAAERILSNLPDQKSKASLMLGRQYPDQVRRLRWIADESQLILDEVSVQNTKRQAQNIYHAAGRTENKGTKGALKNLGSRRPFDDVVAGQQPAPNPEVLAWMKEHGFTTYEAAMDHVLTLSSNDPTSKVEDELKVLQPDLFAHHERVRPRALAAGMGLTAAELAAIQTFSGSDYRYINPATANDPEWLAKNYPDLVDKADKSLEEWAELQDQLAANAQTLDQGLADRKEQLRILKEEGSLHTGVALEGLKKMPVWKGTGYRGQVMTGKQFYPMFVTKGETYAPRRPTFDWKTITSVSKAESVARGFMSWGVGTFKVLWEFELTNGRDIEGLSLARVEREVALMPGAEFAYGQIEVTSRTKNLNGPGDIVTLRVKAKQIK